MIRVRDLIVGAVALGAFAFGASEALAARGELSARACGEWNWCAPSQGGQDNCDECCGYPLGGFCINDDETEYQGCICYG